jgi:hypothetical protein
MTFPTSINGFIAYDGDMVTQDVYQAEMEARFNRNTTIDPNSELGRASTPANPPKQPDWVVPYNEKRN